MAGPDGLPALAEASGTIDLERLLDDRPVGTFQIRVFVLCGLVGILDGLNTQSIGVAAKTMARDFHIRLASFGPVFSAMLLGATLGAIVFGTMGDRFGRKRPIIVSVVIIAVFTLLTPATHTIGGLVIVRFLLGIGLGGATPGFLALGSEYAPARLRQRLVSVIWLSFPLGGVLGAFQNAYLLGHYSWQAVFYVGGAIPVMLLLVLVFGLPESIRFLVAGNRNTGAIDAILRRLAPDMSLAANGRLTVHREPAQAPTTESLLHGRNARSTFALWGSFLMMYGTLTALTLWAPTLLAMNSMSGPRTAIAVGFNGFGALFGVGFAGLLLDRFGKSILVFALILGAISVAAIGFVGDAVIPVIILMTLAGFFVSTGASGGIALTVENYPTAARSRGLGWAMGAGRFGQFLAPLVIGLLVLAAWSIPTIFMMIAALPLLGAMLMLLVRRRSTSIESNVA